MPWRSAPELAEVQFAQALHVLYFDRHWRHSEPFFRRAIEINPRWSLARAFHGVALAGMYRLDEARVEAAASIELDPLSPFIHGAAGMAYFAGGDVPAAEQAARRALQLQPDFLMGVWLLAIALDDKGELDEAARLMEQTTALSRAPIFVSMLGKIYALPAAARRLRPHRGGARRAAHARRVHPARLRRDDRGGRAAIVGLLRARCAPASRSRPAG